MKLPARCGSLVLLTLALVLLSGCGGGDSTRPATTARGYTTPVVKSGGRPITPAEAIKIARANVAISLYCLKTMGPARAPDDVVQDAVDGVDLVERFYWRNPAALVHSEDGQVTIRRYLARIAANLKKCDADEAERIRDFLRQ